MEADMLERIVESYSKEPVVQATGEEQIMVIIECPNAGNEEARSIQADMLSMDLDNHFVHAVKKCDKKDPYALTTKEFFSLAMHPSPIDILMGNMEECVEDCHQVQICTSGQAVARDIAFMDRESGRQPYSDLSAYYLFNVQWHKDDVMSAVVSGFCLSDYIRFRLAA